MTGPAEFLNVQNGIPTGKSLTPGAALYLHNGRGLAAYTHDDVLYQAYLIAHLVLNTINNGAPAPLNRGQPSISAPEPRMVSAPLASRILRRRW